MNCMFLLYMSGSPTSEIQAGFPDHVQTKTFKTAKANTDINEKIISVI